MSRLVTAGILAVLLVGGGVLWYGMDLDSGSPPDPAASRQRSRALLERHAQALEAYRHQHDGSWPDSWLALRRFTVDHDHVPSLGLDDVIAPQVGQYRYRPPQASDPDDALVMAAARPHPLVAPAEPWGQAQAERSHPAVAYGLDAALQVVEMSPDEHRVRSARLFTESSP